MSDRTRAIEVLKKARDLLASRLTDRIVEMEEEILDDACGFSFMGEIESLHEQIGAKLLHLSQMISALPAESQHGSATPFEHDSSTPAWDPIDVAPEALSLTHDTCSEQALILPAPRISEVIAATPQPISLQTFAAQILVGDLETASRSLELLFACRRELAIRCAHRFYEKYLQDPSMLIRVQRLRQAIGEGSEALPLLLLQECFELNQVDATTVLAELRQRFGFN